MRHKKRRNPIRPKLKCMFCKSTNLTVEGLRADATQYKCNNCKKKFIKKYPRVNTVNARVMTGRMAEIRDMKIRTEDDLMEFMIESHCNTALKRDTIEHRKFLFGNFDKKSINLWEQIPKHPQENPSKKYNHEKTN